MKSELWDEEIDAWSMLCAGMVLLVRCNGDVSDFRCRDSEDRASAGKSFVYLT